jgi:hypothetical protein
MSQPRSDRNRPKPPARRSAAGRGTASSNRRSAAPWLIGGAVAVVALIAFLVASISAGGDESADGIQETAAVTITGDSLPRFPDGQTADPAVGLAMPEVEGESFDGTPVTITNDGRAKVLIFLAHW